jgi:hypothetical protein
MIDCLSQLRVAHGSATSAWIHLICPGNEGDICCMFLLSSLFLYLLVIVGCFLRIYFTYIDKVH